MFNEQEIKLVYNLSEWVVEQLHLCVYYLEQIES